MMNTKKLNIQLVLAFLFSLSAAAQVPPGIYGFNGTGYGSIFRFDPSAGTDTLLYKATTASPGMGGGYTPGKDGKFYGISAFGGSSNLGVIYSFDPVTGIYTPLVSFTGANGANGIYSTANNLILAADNYFYGMTFSGGTNNAGTIFRFDTVTNTISVLYSFDDYLNTYPGYPSSGFRSASDGKFYGMISGGGTSGKGYVFQFDPGTAHFQAVFSFDGTNGAQPNNGLVQGEKGKLYGVVDAGGTNDLGVIFSLDLATLKETVLYNMDASVGAAKGSLLFATDGNLYGITFYQGMLLHGSFFRFNPSTKVMKVLRAYDGDAYGMYGSAPVSQIVQADNGNLYYGLSSYAHIYGIIVSYNPSTMQDSIASIMTASNGGCQACNAPIGLLFQSSVSTNAVSELNKASDNLSVYPNPTTGEVKVDILQPGCLIKEVGIYNSLGAEVVKQKAINSAGLKLNIASQPDGVYFLRIDTSNGVVFKPVVVRR
jgi:uncharacterized repeat protein (TIGR03803 family)